MRAGKIEGSLLLKEKGLGRGGIRLDQDGERRGSRAHSPEPKGRSGEMPTARNWNSEGSCQPLNPLAGIPRHVPGPCQVIKTVPLVFDRWASQFKYTYL